MGHVGLDTNKIVYMYEQYSTMQHEMLQMSPGSRRDSTAGDLEGALYFRPSKLLEMTCLELIQTG